MLMNQETLVILSFLPDVRARITRPPFAPAGISLSLMPAQWLARRWLLHTDPPAAYTHALTASQSGWQLSVDTSFPTDGTIQVGSGRSKSISATQQCASWKCVNFQLWTVTIGSDFQLLARSRPFKRAFYDFSRLSIVKGK
jgi:hypothetical protein